MNTQPGLDVSAVAYVIGLVLASLGVAMLVPMAVDLIGQHQNWQAFAISAFVTTLAGASLAISARGGVGNSLTIKQIFMLTTGMYVVLPGFGAIPFVIGEPGISFIDAFFEAMSGLTTTGATVITGLEELPPGVLLWRGLLQWFGGIGIVVVALSFCRSSGSAACNSSDWRAWIRWARSFPAQSRLRAIFRSSTSADWRLCTGLLLCRHGAAGLDCPFDDHRGNGRICKLR